MCFLSFVWRQLEFAFFGALTSVGALFVFTDKQYTKKGERKMTKKLLFTVVLLLTFVCMFASCDNSDTPIPNTPDNSTHTHSYGEWEISKVATCTTEGSKERYCSCGEKQIATVSMTEHTYSNWEITKEATFLEKGVESRKCNCGKEETRDIAKKESETKTLTASECLDELNTVYLNSFSQKTVWFDENGWIYARYYDGTESYAYFASEKYGITKNLWYGKIDGICYYLEERITSTETTKTYEVISELELVSSVENAGDGFQYLEYAISLAEEASSFNCNKTTKENGTVYELALIVDGNFEKITITVVDGLITVYDHADYTTATYTYDKKITMPSLNGYNAAN